MRGERRDEHGATCSCESCEMWRELRVKSCSVWEKAKELAGEDVARAIDLLITDSLMRFHLELIESGEVNPRKTPEPSYEKLIVKKIEDSL